MTDLDRIIAEMGDCSLSERVDGGTVRDWRNRLAALAGAAPVAYMRRWAFDGVKVMAHRKADRPRGWNLHAVTESKLLDDDAPLYHAPAKAREDGLAVALRHVVKVLGPNVPSSVTDQGARYEWDEALRVAESALATFAEGAE